MATTTVPAYVWTARDARGWDKAIPQAIARAEFQLWDKDETAGLGFAPLSTGSRVADLRALVLATAYVAEGFSTNGHAGGTQTILDPAGLTYANAERKGAADVLCATWIALAKGGSLSSPAKFTTNDGQGAVRDAGFGFPAAAALAFVGGAFAWSAAAMYCVWSSDKLVNDELARMEDSRRLEMQQATALKVLAAHQEKEAAAGAPLPLDDASKSILETLRQVQLEVVKRTPPPASNPLGLSLNLGDLAMPLALVLGGWLLLRS